MDECPSAGQATTIRVLIVDDNPRDAARAIAQLRGSGIAVDVRIATRERAFRTALEEFRPDAIVCDFSFADFDGLSASKIAAAVLPGTPLIFASETINEERAVIAVTNGAADYILKTNLQRLPGAITRAVAEAREKAHCREAETGLLRLNRIRDVLCAVNSAIVRIEEPVALFREACRIATAVGGFPAAMIATMEHGSDAGVLQALSPEFPPELADRIATEMARRPLRLSGVIAESLREQRPVAANDLERTPLRTIGADELLNAGVRAIACFPFTIDGANAGIFLLGAAEPGFFNDDELELVTALTNSLAFALQLGSKRRRVDYLSHYDPLTELPNRKLVHERLRREVAGAKRRKGRLAMIVFDLHEIASINTTVGEWAGDVVLRAVARRLTERIDSWLVGRIGSDRFSILIPDMGSVREVMTELSGDGLALLEAPIVAGERELRVTAHVGCAVYPDDGDDADAIFHNAQAALHGAHAAGVAYRFYSPDVDAELSRRLDFEARLRKAVADESFLLHYQPKVDLATGKIAGAEALIRWRDPERPGTLISPGEFIPILEETGLICEVGRWAFGEAMRQRHLWLEAGLAAPRIAVNIAAVQLRSDLVDEITTALRVYGESGLDIEVTESALMSNLSEAIATLRRIREMGVEIALDDFGTGYSSLSYLFQLPIGAMKIDRSFIDGMTGHRDKVTMVSTMISLGRELKLTVIAEGVETEEQAQLLRLLGCDQMQGFLFARALPPDELASMLECRSPVTTPRGIAVAPA